MSTKTTFKRIALATALALTLGSFTALSASAAVSTARTVFVDSTGSTTYDDAAQTVYAASIGNAKTASIALTTATAVTKEAEFGKYGCQIRFLAAHGLRWSEALALTPEDFKDGRISVTKSIHGESKSKSSVRVVPQLTEFAEFPRSPKTLRNVLDPHGVCIHSLRHTYAYLLKQQGIHVTTAQRLLGHSDSRITMNIYTQVLDEEIDSAGALLRLKI